MNGTARRLRPRPVGDHGILGAGEPLEPALDLGRLDPVREVGLAHVEEVAEDHRRPRAPDRLGQGLVVVGRRSRSLMNVASRRSRMPSASTVAPELADQRQLGVLVGLEKPMSKAITFAPSRARMSTSAAIFERGHGQRPSASRLFSSITASVTAGDGGESPRERTRRS